jgi:hypothetical protein
MMGCHCPYIYYVKTAVLRTSSFRSRLLSVGRLPNAVRLFRGRGQSDAYRARLSDLQNHPDNIRSAWSMNSSTVLFMWDLIFNNYGFLIPTCWCTTCASRLK